MQKIMNFLSDIVTVRNVVVALLVFLICAMIPIRFIRKIAVIGLYIIALGGLIMLLLTVLELT